MLIRRIIFAVVLVLPIITVIVFAPHPWSSVVASLLYLVAAWEWSGFLRRQPDRQAFSIGARLAVVAGYALLMSVIVVGMAQFSIARYVFFVAFIWWIVALIWITRYPTEIPNWVTLICGAFVIVPALTALLHARMFVDGPSNALMFLFILVWAADVGAYFVGRTFGQRKLAPKVSPGKSWEGFFGGMVAALIVAGAVAIATEIPLIHMLPLAFIVVAGSVVGDLTVSMFKRNAGVKDAGVIFPGHGGVLDRFDSFSAAAPIMYAIGAVYGQPIARFFQL